MENVRDFCQIFSASYDSFCLTGCPTISMSGVSVRRQIFIHTMSVINCILVCSLVHPSIYTLNHEAAEYGWYWGGGSQVLGEERNRVTK